MESSRTACRASQIAEISGVETVTLQQWRALYFGTTNNSGNAANSANPDGDSLVNLLEYAFALNPTNQNPAPQFTPVLVQSNNTVWFGCSFPRNAKAGDIAFEVQAAPVPSSSDWLNIATRSAGGGWTGPAIAWESSATQDTVRVTVLNTQPLALATNRFLRLQVLAP